MDGLCNFYQLLGVATNASTEEIQKAYRSKAKECHPDMNGGTEQSKELFQRLGAAKDCLIDPAKRLEYDYFIGIKRKPYQQRAHSGPGPDPSQQYRPRSSSSSSDAMWGVVAVIAISAFFSWLFGDEEEDASKRRY